MEDKVLVQCKRRDLKGSLFFAEQLNELYAKGYKIKTEDLSMSEAPCFGGVIKVWMVKPSITVKAVEKKEEVKEETPKTKKKDEQKKDIKTEKSKVEDFS